VRQAWINCGRPHAELVAADFETTFFSATRKKGDLMRRAEHLKSTGEMPGASV
jgi:hypothetical protein